MRPCLDSEFVRAMLLTRFNNIAHLARNLTAVQNATAQVASFSPKFCYFKTVDQFRISSAL